MIDRHSKKIQLWLKCPIIQSLVKILFKLLQRMLMKESMLKLLTGLFSFTGFSLNGQNFILCGYVYSLEASDSEFTINSQNGQISTLVNLITEKRRIFHLKVVAKDHGSPSLSSTALVVVQFGDTDAQSSLMFQKSLYETSLLENSMDGTEVIQVTNYLKD